MDAVPRVLVWYASAAGSTRGIAERTADRIEADRRSRGTAHLQVLCRPAGRELDPEDVDALIVGSAVGGMSWLTAATVGPVVLAADRRQARRPPELAGHRGVGRRHRRRGGSSPGNDWSEESVMRLAGKDRLATGLVAAVVVIFAAYLAAGRVWFVDTVREMALVGLVGGFLSRLIGGRAAFSPRRPAVVAAFTTLGLGVLAVITGSGALLAVLVAADVVLCVTGVVVQRRAGPLPVQDRSSAGAHR